MGKGGFSGPQGLFNGVFPAKPEPREDVEQVCWFHVGPDVQSDVEHPWIWRMKPASLLVFHVICTNANPPCLAVLFDALGLNMPKLLILGVFMPAPAWSTLIAQTHREDSNI